MWAGRREGGEDGASHSFFRGPGENVEDEEETVSEGSGGKSQVRIESDGFTEPTESSEETLRVCGFHRRRSASRSAVPRKYLRPETEPLNKSLPPHRKCPPVRRRLLDSRDLNFLFVLMRKSTLLVIFCSSWQESRAH